MYVKSLDVDDDTLHHGSEYTSNPSWQDIEVAIRSLNGCNRTLLLLKHEEVDGLDNSMGIGGGGENQVYFCQVIRNGCEVQLVDESLEGDEIEMVVSTRNTYPVEFGVSLEAVLLAAEEFSKTGKLYAALTWWNLDEQWPFSAAGQDK